MLSMLRGSNSNGIGGASVNEKNTVVACIKDELQLTFSNNLNLISPYLLFLTNQQMEQLCIPGVHYYLLIKQSGYPDESGCETETLFRSILIWKVCCGLTQKYLDKTNHDSKKFLLCFQWSKQHSRDTLIFFFFFLSNL